ncbi:hypothetical protein LPJ63_004073 [Coemansia sp. RSA 2711]|nr:hypothetical protein LPJ63_004073 [Coemansia sp. RSA 2711]
MDKYISMSELVGEINKRNGTSYTAIRDAAGADLSFPLAVGFDGTTFIASSSHVTTAIVINE